MKMVTTFPSVTTTERNALTSVPTGAVVLNTDTNQFEKYNGATWTAQTGASSVSTSDTRISVGNGNGYGSTGTRTRRFSNILVNNGGPDISYTQDATNGDYFTINTAGIYHIDYFDESTNSTGYIGVTVNAAGTAGGDANAPSATDYRATDIYSIPAGTIRISESSYFSNSGGVGDQVMALRKLNPGDKLRMQTNANPNGTSNNILVNVIKISGDSGSSTTSYIALDTGNGTGSESGSRIRRFTNISASSGTDITYVDDPVTGASFLINVAGMYCLSYSDSASATNGFGFSLNPDLTQRATDAIALAPPTRIIFSSGPNGATPNTCVSRYFPAGSVIRPHIYSQSGLTATNLAQCIVARVSSGGGAIGAAPTSVMAHQANATSGYGSAGTKIRYYATTTVNLGGDDITYFSSSVDGDKWRINTAGVYAITVADIVTTGSTAAYFGVSKNAAGTSDPNGSGASQLTTHITGLANGTINLLAFAAIGTASQIPTSSTVVVALAAGDMIRMHGGAEAGAIGNSGNATFRIAKVTGSSSTGSAAQPASEIWVSSDGGGAGHNGNRRTYGAIGRNTGGVDLTYSAAAGTITINTSGIYAVSCGDYSTTTAENFGVVLNHSGSYNASTSVQRVTQGTTYAVNFNSSSAGVARLTAGDVLSVNDQTNMTSNDKYSFFHVTRIG